MARFVFGKILSDSIKSGMLEASTRESNRWYRRMIPGSHISVKDISTLPRGENQKTIRGEMIGNLYFFGYSPRTKETLPYWDAFPLALITDVAPGGVYGINFHYLSYTYRASLMDSFLELERESTDEHSGVLDKRKITYSKIKRLTEYKYYKPAFKRYYFSNMTTRMIELTKAEWKIALYLPTDNFQKKRRRHVWEESRKQIRDSN